MEFNFNTRAEYLAYTDEWKDAYKTLSAEIRAIKHQIKEESRERGYTYLWYDLRSAKDIARTLINERHAAKVEAARQYRENKVQAV